MDEKTIKRVEEIEARVKRVNDAKAGGNYCESHSAMHRFEGAAFADVEFLLSLLTLLLIEANP